jgi:hypothetical protein
MIRRLLQAGRVLRSRFGHAKLSVGLGLLAHRALVAAGWALDPWVSPGLRRWRVRPPVFVVGNPRSGTTFLHRWLVAHGVGAGFELWQLLWPAVCLRPFVRPMLRWLERVSPARFHGGAAHPTSLTSVETDDALLFFRFFDGLFAWGYVLAWDDAEHPDALDARPRETAARDYAFLAEAQRRNAWWHGANRAVGKLFSMALRPEETLAAFPDARFLLLLRDPVDVIPSGLSLLDGVVGRAFDVARVPAEVRARRVARLYDASLRMYRGLAEAHRAGKLPPDRVRIVRYDALMADFETEMRSILAFVDHPVDDALAVAIRDTAARQRAWTSPHAYDAARFGLDPARIRADTAFLEEVFGPLSPPRSTPLPP